jgi:Na+-driven multidrug efflux pump
MALQRVVNSFGTVVVAAFTATSRIEQFIHQPYMTLGASLSTYCGQNFGAKKNDRVLAGYRRGLLLMAVITAVMVLVMQTLGGAIAGIFVTDAEIRDLGAAGLRITSLFYITLGVIYVVRGLLTGVGDAFFALFNGIVEVIGRFTVPVLMTSFLGFGAAGIWWSSGIVWMISGVTAWLRYFIHFRGNIMHQNTGEARD